MNPTSFTAATIATFLCSLFFGDIVRLRFYVKHHHVHHALYGILLLPFGAFTAYGWVLGVCWGLLLSEAKFFITRLEGVSK